MSERAPQIDRDRAVRLQWASDALDVPVTASGAEVRKAFLRSLAEDDFLPPVERHEALRYLQHDPADPAEKDDLAPVVVRPVPEIPWECHQAVEESLLAEVEEFAGQLFQLSPTERRERWRELEARSREYMRALARLEALVAGISVELARLDPGAPALRDLVERLCQLYVLRPLSRAALRERFLEEWAQESSKWQIAARLLASKHADIAALDWPLVTYLEKPAAKKTAAAPANTAFVMQPEVEPAPEPNREGKNPHAWWGGAAVFFVIVLLRAATLGGCNPSRPEPHVPKLSREEIDQLLDDIKSGRFKHIPENTNESSPHDWKIEVDPKPLKIPEYPDPLKIYPFPDSTTKPPDISPAAPKVGPELPPGYKPPRPPSILLEPDLLNPSSKDPENDIEP